jgi:hypothetical protein
MIVEGLKNNKKTPLPFLEEALIFEQSKRV